MIDKYTLIKLKLGNMSNREVAATMKIDRKTVSTYWSEYLALSVKLADETKEVHQIQRKIVESKKYDTSNRKRSKYTDDIDRHLNLILDSEIKKDKRLGPNKQHLSCEQIHKMITSMGFDIGLTTITAEISKKRNRHKECFIKQDYSLSDRLEYDFGEAKVDIGGIIHTVSMAVFASPGSHFKWCYVYKSQDKDVFMDSHVRFFEMVKGVYKEVVYDNMRNVVSKFIGRNDKQLNQDLIKMSLYYGFKINVTNCFSGNEKGTVESTVKKLRNQLFATKYCFNNFEEIEQYVEQELVKINANTLIEEEKKLLLPYKPKFELAKISSNIVNKYSCVRVDNNFYSVPEYLVDKPVNIHNYINQIVIYINNEKVAEHKKIDGFEHYKIDIMHYLNTFKKKPGALQNSSALKNIPKLKTIYDNYFTTKPKNFILTLHSLKDKNIDEVVSIIEEMVKTPITINCDETIVNDIEDNITVKTQEQIVKITQIFTLGGLPHAN